MFEQITPAPGNWFAKFADGATAPVAAWVVAGESHVAGLIPDGARLVRADERLGFVGYITRGELVAARDEDLDERVIAVLREHPEGRDIAQLMAALGVPKQPVRVALARLEATDLVVAADGPRGSKIWKLAKQRLA